MSVPTRLGLLQFLKKAVLSHRTPPPGTAPIYVLGNPSADLDSIISAIVYAYFSTRVVCSSPQTSHTRQYIPVINLPDVPSGKELRRLRPEFATALRLATATDSSSAGSKHETHVDAESAMLKDAAFTVADWQESWDADPQLNEGVRSAEDERPQWPEIALVMVDWNALPKISKQQGYGIEGLSRRGTRVFTYVVGCIDHHVDESFVPSSPGSLSEFETRIIQIGVGSCTSLIVRDLRSRGLWTDEPTPRVETDSFQGDGNEGVSSEDVSSIYESQLAKLALAAILIDTGNMTAKDKVSDVDHSAVDFLERKIQRGIQAQRTASGVSGGWDRTQFYEEILHAKRTSLENLTVQEALGRDFKEWTETTTAGEEVKLGICSVVSPLAWLIGKARDSRNEGMDGDKNNDGLAIFFNELKQFAATKGLDIVAVMTAFQSSDPDKSFRRELLVWALNGKSIEGAQRFEGDATAKLGLEAWEVDQKGTPSDGANLSDSGQWRRVWNQAVVSQSRKQVAPLFRDAISKKGAVRDRL